MGFTFHEPKNSEDSSGHDYLPEEYEEFLMLHNDDFY